MAAMIVKEGLDYFLTAATKVLKNFPHVKFWIVGSGPQEETVEKHIELGGLHRHVKLTGFREDIPALLAHMDVFVLASVGAKGIPQALTQAMAME